ncbi:hypothetical protein Btru_050260 [Bulinus truncatus]|nr:hypothetical protein Btru_050260 [Bulinus truncatus]
MFSRSLVNVVAPGAQAMFPRSLVNVVAPGAQAMFPRSLFNVVVPGALAMFPRSLFNVVAPGALAMFPRSLFNVVAPGALAMFPRSLFNVVVPGALAMFPVVYLRSSITGNHNSHHGYDNMSTTNDNMYENVVSDNANCFFSECFIVAVFFFNHQYAASTCDQQQCVSITGYIFIY